MIIKIIIINNLLKTKYEIFIRILLYQLLQSKIAPSLQVASMKLSDDVCDAWGEESQTLLYRTSRWSTSLVQLITGHTYRYVSTVEAIDTVSQNYMFCDTVLTPDKDTLISLTVK